MILVDNNLSTKIARVMQPTFEGIIHVADVGLDETGDVEIWEYAIENQLDILTKDADFNELLNSKGFPPKVI